MVDEAKLAGREAYGGLDLAATSDLLALCWLFPDDERGGHEALWRLWTPEDNVDRLDQRTAGAASRWVRDGLLVATPGNVADYDYVQQQIERDLSTFDVRSLGFDPWSAVPLTNELAKVDAPMAFRNKTKLISTTMQIVRRVAPVVPDNFVQFMIISPFGIIIG